MIGLLNAVDLDGEEVTLAGVAIRALQLADDVAIFAKSPQDLEKLVLAWEKYCDRHHMETQVKKTEIMVATWEGDSDLYLRGDVLMQKSRGRELIGEYLFSYKGSRLSIVEFFTYLGVFFHWKQDATEAWEDREGTAHKAFGALKGTLFLAPHLPFDRLRMVVFAIVGGVYRYGAESWGPFIPMSGPSPGSRISKAVTGWLTGFGHTKVERCRGWFHLRELDTEAQASALRAVHDACERGGLLGRAVEQLHDNWSGAGRGAGGTWMGRLHKVVRKTWPQFKVSRGPLTIEGRPASRNSLPIAKDYCDAVWERTWKCRQDAVLRKPPTDKQQDYIFHALLRELNGHSLGTVTEPIFPFVPSVEADAFQTLLRFLAGKCDFARVHAQNHRLDANLCGLLLRDFQHKRYCPWCWGYKHRLHLDSEWHSALACPYTERPRERFRLALRSFGQNITLPSDWILFPRDAEGGRAPEVRDLAVFILKCRMHGNLLVELSRFVVELLSHRERLYRYCIARGSTGRFPTPNTRLHGV